MVERTAVACMKQQLAKLRVAGKTWCCGESKIIETFLSRYPRLSPAGGFAVAMPPYGEVAREWVQTAQVQTWLARVLQDLGGERLVS